MSTKENLEATFKGETSEVGLYLAMSKRAEEEGHANVAQYLRQVAMDESWHAAEAATILGMISNTKSNVEKMLSGEMGATKAKANAAEEALKEGNQAAADFFKRASCDEDRHRAGLKGLLDQL